ncbi:RHS repeat-associated core domain-containing protein [Calidifontibacter indicus]|uniref:RHS repeat-associated core domain-containing protein n=1 Tax=Calidifontibacter indicus TaxID=419650 RepID=UPI003D725EE8
MSYQGAYDENGTLVRQNLPGGVTQITDTNELKDETGLRYEGQVTPTTATTNPDTGEVIWTPGTPKNGTWVAWSIDRDGLGRAVREYTGAGAGFDGDPGVPANGDTSHLPVGTGRGYDRAYTYTTAGQLASVTDRTAAVQIGPVAPATGSADGKSDGSTTPVTGLVCQNRSYGFNVDGARTSWKIVQHTDGDCDGTATGTVTTTTIGHTYDNANRLTVGATINGTSTGAYTYDGLGRQTSVPASDAPNHGTTISLGYYVDDLPATATQGAVTTSFALDSQGRRGTQTTTGGSTDGQSVVRHYGDDSDNPAWSVTTPKGGTATTTRYTNSLSGDLGATITGTGDASIPLVDPHGSNVTALTIPAAQSNATACVGLDGWSDYTEYGGPAYGSTQYTPGVTGPLGYGWLGSKQRETSSETGGLMLMGVRYYNWTTGAFTSPDPIPGGNDTSYGYPTDPINNTDTTGQWGCGWCKRAMKKAWKYRGTIATVAAASFCFVPAVGWAACGVATAGAFAVRAQQRGFRNRENIRDGMITMATFGVGQAFRSVQVARRARWHSNNQGMTSLWKTTGRYGRATVRTGAQGAGWFNTGYNQRNRVRHYANRFMDW